MDKFFLMTRGRTGSTAIIDELNNTGVIRTDQELFILRDFSMMSEQELRDEYFLIMPFDIWKKRRAWLLGFLSADKREEMLANIYLGAVEIKARLRGAKVFGFKILSHHFEQRPFLENILRRRGYRAIYLTRNLARQVISGMIAKQRGIYNSKRDIDDCQRYTIDLDQFQKLVEWEANCVKTDCAWLKEKGFNPVVVTYEEFNANRQAFFERIFNFLGVRSELPGASTYSVMIKDLSKTIENYDAVAEKSSALGMPLDT